MIFFLLGCTGFGGKYLRNISHAEQTKSAERLRIYLQHPKYSYVREQAALSLAELPKDQPSIPILRNCLNNSLEKDYVRAACAQPLGAWKVGASDTEMIAALEEVDLESAYWIASALKELQTPLSIAALSELREVEDFFLSASAREWLGE